MDKCIEIQQHFYENLGTRDYDCFQGNQIEYLKLKIGFSVFGIPKNNKASNTLDDDLTAEKVYDAKQNILINNIISIIKSKSVYNANKDEIFIAFLFNCCLFAKKKSAEVKIGVFPVFKVKKCSCSPKNNCCVFIDEHARVYKNWEDYLENNKIPKAVMCLPKNGKYHGNEEDKVILSYFYSPACSLKAEAVKVADISTTVASFLSGGIAIGSLIPAITVAPVVLTGALITGAGVGIYSIIRSSFRLHDRNTHDQSISLANDEARNCYLNIAAGATTVVTTGATKIASLALRRGVTFGEGVATALLSVNALNLTVNGCNVVNSIYLIANDIKNKKNPSALDIMHLTTTVLFFGHAVVNFKSACTIYKDTTATKSFTDIIRSHSEDLWLRAKTKFFKADMTSVENNASIDIIQDSADFYSNTITCVIKEKAVDGAISTAMRLLVDFIREIDLEGLQKFGQDIINNIHDAETCCKLIFAKFESNVQDLLIKMLKFLLNEVIQEACNTLKKIYPRAEIFVILLNFVIKFLNLKVTEMEIDYHKTAENVRNQNISQYDKNVFGLLKTAARRLSTLKMICEGGVSHEILFREMVTCFWEWLTEKAFNYAVEQSEQSQQYDNSFNVIQRRKMLCFDCGGFYYND